MRVDANPNAVQFAMLSRTTGQIQKLQSSSVASDSGVQKINGGDQFTVQTRAEVRAAQQADRAAQFQQAAAQHPPQASLSGLENGRRFQPDFAKPTAETAEPLKTSTQTQQASTASITGFTNETINKSTTESTTESTNKSTTEPTSESTNAAGVYGQDQLDAINEFFGAKTGDSRFQNAVDFNNDGSINFSDITYVLSKWGEALPADQQVMPQPDLSGPFGKKHLDAVNEFFGKSLGDEGFLAQADANGDGTINFSDITHILSNWGQPTETGSA